MQTAYLDNNATSQPDPAVVDAMHQMLTEHWGNPSSVHRFGQSARQKVELARASVAKLLGCKDKEVLFTSGGTEANNLALRGVLDGAAGSTPDSGPRVLITTTIEHAAIREPADWLEKQGITVVRLPVDIDGWVEPFALDQAIRDHLAPGATLLVTVQWANNETGLILPIEAYADKIEQVRSDAREQSLRCKLLFHVDATQAVGKLPVSQSAGLAQIDLLTCSAHKFHGPKGVGCLRVRTGVRVRPQQRGGPQEREKRGGTENTPGMVGMGVAADLARAFLSDEAPIDRVQALRDRLENGLRERLPQTVVNAAGRPRLWNTTNVGFPRLEAEAILLGLSERGVYASAGAACSSGSLEPSPILLAMGIAEPIAHGSVRFSLSRFTTDADIDHALNVIPHVIKKLSETLPG